MDHRVRVVVANQPRLMRELVLRTVRDQPDIEVVAEVENESDIIRAVNESNPDFLIVSLNEFDRYPTICDVLLRNQPRMKVLALAAERNSSLFLWVSFDVCSIPVEPSEAGILGTLRGKSLSGAGGLA
jgi:DNA-binding NarL/FixJ family response regulator